MKCERRNQLQQMIQGAEWAGLGADWMDVGKRGGGGDRLGFLFNTLLPPTPSLGPFLETQTLAPRPYNF